MDDLLQGCLEGQLNFCLEGLVEKRVLCGHTPSGQGDFPPLGESHPGSKGRSLVTLLLLNLTLDSMRT